MIKSISIQLELDFVNRSFTIRYTKSNDIPCGYISEQLFKYK